MRLKGTLTKVSIGRHVLLKQLLVDQHCSTEITTKQMVGKSEWQDERKDRRGRAADVEVVISG